MKRTKIVATLGPASNTPETIARLIEAGANVFRLNFSHGTHESHAALIQAIRTAAGRVQRHVSILGDLCGPKIRVGTFKNGPVTLKPGSLFFLTPDADTPGDESGVGTSYPYLLKDVQVGHRVLLDDGNISLEAVEKKSDRIVFRVIDGGLLKDKKGMNLVGMPLTIETITAKDKDDLKFMIAQDLDYVALSFVRKASDIRELRSLMGHEGPRVIAKIEKPEAITELEGILDHVDGIMIARGDLGVEMPIEQVPGIQKHIITRCSRRGILVITATQMLESMIGNSRPTRAEASDVFNAVLDGTDAIMLSGETASGQYPVEAVQMMAALAVEAEKIAQGQYATIMPEVQHAIEDTIAHAASESAVDAGAKCIVAYTHSGNTAHNISKYHSPLPVYALTPRDKTCRRLALNWGVTSVQVPDSRNTDEMFVMAEKVMKEQGYQSGDVIAIVAGVPLGVKGNTNMLKLHKLA